MSDNMRDDDIAAARRRYRGPERREVAPALDVRLEAGRAAAESRLRQRAVMATGLSFTVTDAQHPDHPLVWVNPAFTATTGYSFAEAVGRNCRFLQGAERDAQNADALRRALDERREVTVTLRNFRKNGEPFWNAVTVSPVFGGEGELTHFVGIQTDVTEQVEAGRLRDEALLAERRANLRAERLHSRLALLAAASSQLALSFDVDDSLHRLAALMVPSFADSVVVHRVDAGGQLAPEAIVGDQQGRPGLTEHVRSLLAAALARESPVHAVVQDGQDWLVADLDPDQALTWSTGSARASVRDLLSVTSTILVALPGRHGVLGAMVLRRDDASPRFSSQDLAVAVDIGRRAGVMVDAAGAYHAVEQVAATLQRSLTAPLPEIGGLDIAGLNRAAAASAEIGGDFYDVLDLPDGATAVVIGDVVGHDLAAAAAMGQLRGVIRAVAWDSLDAEHSTATEVLRRVDAVVRGLAVAPMATVAYARLERSAGDSTLTVRYASAGHPPMLIRDADGTARFLRGEPGLLLGVQPAERITYTDLLPEGATLVAFTDGLVERRGEDIDVGMERLRGLVAQASQVSAQGLCDYLLHRLPPGEDDSAVIAVRNLGSG